jgi:hypothetical protein
MAAAVKRKNRFNPVRARATPKIVKKTLRMALEPVLLPSTIFASGTYLYPCQVRLSITNKIGRFC